MIPGAPLTGLWGSYFHIWPEPHQNQGLAHFQDDLPALELPEYPPSARNLLETPHPRFISTIEWPTSPCCPDDAKDRHTQNEDNQQFEMQS